MPTQTGSIDMKGQKAAADIGLEVDQHFWYDSSGAHVTEVTQEEFTDPSDPSYHSGGNTLMTSTDVKIRDGVTDLAIFGSGGAVVGENASGKSRTEIGTDGMQIYQNVNGTDKLIANLGYGDGNNDVGGTSKQPYYKLGSGIANDNYSTSVAYKRGMQAVYGGKTYVCIYDMSVGEAWTPSHWEIAIGNYSVSEGEITAASGAYSHAEGSANTAHGQNAHAEGESCIAWGDYSHAQNRFTKAFGDHQTVIGKYNDNQLNNAFEIGNGTSDNARSNALTVDWDGNVCMALDTTAASGTDHDLYAAINALGWASDVIV